MAGSGKLSSASKTQARRVVSGHRRVSPGVALKAARKASHAAYDGMGKGSTVTEIRRAGFLAMAQSAAFKRAKKRSERAAASHVRGKGGKRETLAQKRARTPFNGQVPSTWLGRAG